MNNPFKNAANGVSNAAANFASKILASRFGLSVGLLMIGSAAAIAAEPANNNSPEAKAKPAIAKATPSNVMTIKITAGKDKGKIVAWDCDQPDAAGKLYEKYGTDFEIAENQKPAPKVKVKTDVKADPVKTDVEADPVKTDVEADPVKTDVEADPVKTDVKADPAKTDVKADPVKTDVKADPVKTDVKADPVKTDVKEDAKIGLTEVTGDSTAKLLNIDENLWSRVAGTSTAGSRALTLSLNPATTLGFQQQGQGTDQIIKDQRPSDKRWSFLNSVETWRDNTKAYGWGDSLLNISNLEYQFSKDLTVNWYRQTFLTTTEWQQAGKARVEYVGFKIGTGEPDKFSQVRIGRQQFNQDGTDELVWSYFGNLPRRFVADAITVKTPDHNGSNAEMAFFKAPGTGDTNMMLSIGHSWRGENGTGWGRFSVTNQWDGGVSWVGQHRFNERFTLSGELGADKRGRSMMVSGSYNLGGPNDRGFLSDLSLGVTYLNSNYPGYNMRGFGASLNYRKSAYFDKNKTTFGFVNLGAGFDNRGKFGNTINLGVGVRF